jgi:hypothetical protein
MAIKTFNFSQLDAAAAGAAAQLSKEAKLCWGCCSVCKDNAEPCGEI